MSPRICVILSSQAHDIYDRLHEDIGSVENWGVIHMELIKHTAHLLPDKLYIDTLLQRGFSEVFLHISKCIKDKTLPSSVMVKNSIKSIKNFAPRARNCLHRGGSVDDALRVVFEQARSGCALAGDGSGQALYGDKISGLKRCRNDSEYACATLACGVKDLRVQ